MPSFSDHAVAKLLDLYNNHGHQVGSKLKEREPETYKTYEATDCITYVKQVLLYAYTQSGRTDFATRVQQNLAAHDAAGTQLARFLVEQDNWTGIYVNPNTSYREEGNNNPWWNARDVSRTCRYYDVPTSYQYVNYSSEAPVGIRNSINILNYALLYLVQFGFGCSYGGEHTWLFSHGKAYEVHWLEAPNGNLYERRPLEAFTMTWRTSVIVVPPDAFFDHRVLLATQVVCR